MYKHGIEFISMHFCFVFKRAIAKYDAAWQQDPGCAKAKLIELEKNCKLYCPIGILLQEAFGKKAGKRSQAWQSKNKLGFYRTFSFQQQ